MPRITDLIRKRLLREIPDPMPAPNELRLTERDRRFEELRANRKILGAFRYGRLGAPGKSKYDRVRDMIRRLELYRRDRNAEHLVDVANLAECEFVEGENVWQPQDDGEHTKEL